MRRSIFGFLAVVFAASAEAQAPAARVGDSTDHTGGRIVGPGVPTVIIAGRAAAVVGDQVVCPLADGTVPHVGGPISTASATVFIGGRRAARAGDLVFETGPPSTILPGAVSVLIGP